MILSSADRLLLSGLKLFPSKEDILTIEKCIPEIRDWESLTENIIRNGIAPLMYKNLSSGRNADKMPEETLSWLKQAYYKILGRNVLLIEKFRQIHRLLSEHEIDAIALKGMYLSDALYKNVGLRPMSDIDLLVHDKDADKCREILTNQGYKDTEVAPSEFIKQTEKHLAPLIKDGVSVEIHVKLHNEQYGYTINTEEFWERSRIILLHGLNARVLSPTDMLLHLCIHLDSHNSVSDIQLRLYGDIVNVLEFYRNEINWKLFEEFCERCNCTKNIFKSLLLVKKYFNAAVPVEVFGKYQHFFDNNAEYLFIKVLRLDNEEIHKKKRDFHAARNLQNLGRVKGFKNKLFFLLGDVFPSKAFMCQNYKIKHKGLLFFYYLKRLLIGVFKLLVVAKKHLFSSKSR